MEYRCLECGELFDQPVRKRFRRDQWEDAMKGIRDCSPCCGQDFEDAHLCGGCGEAVDEDGTGGLCARCAQAALVRLKGFVQENYTKQEQEALDILTEGISFTCLGIEEGGEYLCQKKSDGGN